MSATGEQSVKKRGNMFAVLADSDSENEHECEQVKEVKVEEVKRPMNRFRKPEPEIHFMAEEEEKQMPKPIKTPPLITQQTEGEGQFSSLLSRGSTTTGATGAMAWAEKVKQSLEKAEAARKPTAPYQPSEDFIASLGKLSFFRRGNCSTETST